MIVIFSSLNGIFSLGMLGCLIGKYLHKKPFKLFKINILQIIKFTSRALWCIDPYGYYDTMPLQLINLFNIIPIFISIYQSVMIAVNWNRSNEIIVFKCDEEERLKRRIIFFIIFVFLTLWLLFISIPSMDPNFEIYDYTIIMYCFVQFIIIGYQGYYLNNHLNNYKIIMDQNKLLDTFEVNDVIDHTDRQLDNDELHNDELHHDELCNDQLHHDERRNDERLIKQQPIKKKVVNSELDDSLKRTHSMHLLVWLGILLVSIIGIIVLMLRISLSIPHNNLIFLIFFHLIFENVWNLVIFLYYYKL